MIAGYRPWESPDALAYRRVTVHHVKNVTDDTGCHLFGSCLECPIEPCHEDDAAGSYASALALGLISFQDIPEMHHRTIPIDALRPIVTARIQAGEKPLALAGELGINRSTFYRWLRRFGLDLGYRSRQTRACDVCGALFKAKNVWVRACSMRCRQARTRGGGSDAR